MSKILIVDDGPSMVCLLTEVMEAKFCDQKQHTPERITQCLSGRSVSLNRSAACLVSQGRKPRVTTLGSCLVAPLLLLVIFFSWANTLVLAQEDPRDLAELTLEDLMKMDILFVDVLGTHTHLAGEWMIGYKFMFMKMDGNRDGTDRKTESDVLQTFPVTPVNMNMGMHMVDVMYAPSDDLTLMAMFPFVQLSMDHVTRMGVQFTTEAQGIGDVSLSALYTFYGDVREERRRLVFIPGLSLPTGSIDRRDATPAGPNQQLPYPMQLGSGTVDLLPSIAYLGEGKNWAWKAQAGGTLRLGKNSNNYRLGNRLHLTASATRKLSNVASLSAQIDGRGWGNIRGADSNLNPAMVPTADPNRRGGERVDLFFGLNLYIPEGTYEGNRVALDVGFPIYQSLDGPQLETDWQLAVGWNWTF